MSTASKILLVVLLGFLAFLLWSAFGGQARRKLDGLMEQPRRLSEQEKRESVGPNRKGKG